jgi:hypothetical protein
MLSEIDKKYYNRMVLFQLLGDRVDCERSADRMPDQPQQLRQRFASVLRTVCPPWFSRSIASSEVGGRPAARGRVGLALRGLFLVLPAKKPTNEEKVTGFLRVIYAPEPQAVTPSEN